MKRPLVLLAGLALAASATFADAGGRTKVDYAAYAGDSVREIAFFQLYNWQRSSDKGVVLWTKPSEAWFLTLANTCDGLRGSRVSIEVGGAGAIAGRLRTGDDLIVGPIKCRVVDIKPIDLVALKRDRKA